MLGIAGNKGSIPAASTTLFASLTKQASDKPAASTSPLTSFAKHASDRPAASTTV
jgi:hypothetical protein